MLLLLRQTLRRFGRERGFVFTAVLTLALCIGANVAIYAVVDAVLVRALPFPNADRLVVLLNCYPKAGADRIGASAVNYYERRGGKLPAVPSVAVFSGGSRIVGGEQGATRVPVGAVSPDFFETLGVKLARGHMWSDAEMIYGPDQVAVLTDDYWRTHFQADPNIVGKTFLNDSLPVTIIGVLPPGFHFLGLSKVGFFRPVAHEKDGINPGNRHGNNVQMIGRLAPGATVEQAQAQVDALNAQAEKSDPYAAMVRAAGFHTLVANLHDDVVRQIRPVLLLLEAGVLTLLLIGGSNLINLLLIRANGRSKELAVRQAHGAGARRLSLEILCETMLLSVAGGIAGVVLGAVSVVSLRRLGTDQLPTGAQIQVDGRILGFAFGLALLTGVALAIPVAWVTLRHRLAVALQTESRSGTAGRAAQRLRHAFIVAQISLAFVLLTGAGLLGVSLRRVLSITPGFNPEHVLTGSIDLPWKFYPDAPKQLAYVERLQAALRQQPAITAVAFGSGMPFGGGVNNNATVVEGVNPPPGESIRAHLTSFAYGDYFRALQIPLLEGRLLDPADEHRKERVCVVDAAFARRYWPNGSALGHRLSNEVPFSAAKASTIVGVVGDVKQSDLAETTPLGSIYFPFQAAGGKGFQVIVRTALAPEALATTLRKVAAAVDPGVPVDDVKPLADRIDDTLVARRAPAILAGAFAGVALLLAAVGTYGVLAYAVGQRRREIGVRMALGALPGQIVTQFVQMGGRLLAFGLIVGVVGAWGAGTAMQSLLFGVGAIHGGVLAAGIGLMIAVVLLATFLPSRAAARLSPMDALRSE